MQAECSLTLTGAGLFTPLQTCKPRASGKPNETISHDCAGDNTLVSPRHHDAAAATFGTAGTAAAALRERAVRGGPPAALYTVEGQPLKYKSPYNSSCKSPIKQNFKHTVSPRPSTAATAAKSATSLLAGGVQADVRSADAAVTLLLPQPAVDAIAAVGSTAAGRGVGWSKGSSTPSERMTPAASSGQQQQPLPSKQQLKQEWQQLQQQHLSNHKQQQQAELYQQRLQHQVAMLQEEQAKQQKHQQHGGQQSRLQLKSYSSAYSLRSRTPSPLRSSTPLQNPQQRGVSGLRLRGSSSQAASAAAHKVHATGAESADHLTVKDRHMASAAIRKSRAAAAQQQQHLQCSISNAAAERAMHVVSASVDSAFASKLQHLKSSNQRRLRSALQQGRPQATAAIAGASSSGASCAQQLRNAKLAPTTAQLHDAVYRIQEHCSASRLNCTSQAGEPTAAVAVAEHVYGLPDQQEASGATTMPDSSHSTSGRSCVIGNSSSHVTSRSTSPLDDDAGDTASSISFCVVSSKPQQQNNLPDTMQPRQQQQQQLQRQHADAERTWEQQVQHWRQQKHNLQAPQQLQKQHEHITAGTQQSQATAHKEQQQQEPQRHEQVAPAADWHRRQSRVRTALFVSPSRAGHGTTTSTSSSSCSGSSRGSTPEEGRGPARYKSSGNDCKSYLDSAVQDTIAEAERELQLLLNHTGKEGPTSPVARWEAAAAAAVAGQQHAKKHGGDHFLQGVQLQQLPEWDTTRMPAVSGDSSSPSHAAGVFHGNSCPASDGDSLLHAAEESFLLLLEASTSQQQHQGQHQQPQAQSGQPHSRKQQQQQQQHSPPWRPPGRAIALSSTRSRPGSGGSASKKQHQEAQHSAQQQLAGKQQDSVQHNIGHASRASTSDHAEVGHVCRASMQLSPAHVTPVATAELQQQQKPQWPVQEIRQEWGTCKPAKKEFLSVVQAAEIGQQHRQLEQQQHQQHIQQHQQQEQDVWAQQQHTLLSDEHSTFAALWLRQQHQQQQQQQVSAESGSGPSSRADAPAPRWRISLPESLQSDDEQNIVALSEELAHPPSQGEQHEQLVRQYSSSHSSNGSTSDHGREHQHQHSCGSEATRGQSRQAQPPQHGRAGISTTPEQQQWLLGSANSSSSRVQGAGVRAKQPAWCEYHSGATDCSCSDSEQAHDEQLARAVLQEWSYLAATSAWHQLMHELELHHEQTGHQACAAQEEQPEIFSCTAQRGMQQLVQQQQQQHSWQQASPAFQQVHKCLNAWQDEAQQSAAAAAAAAAQQEQQWALHHDSRLLLKSFRAWSDASSISSWSLRALGEEQARQFHRLWCVKRCFRAWWGSYVPACRVQQLLDDAAAATADDFAAARMQRLLGHCLAGWTAAVLVRGSARAAAAQTLQRVWQQVLLQDWHAAAAQGRRLKGAALTAWRQNAVQQQVERAQSAAAAGMAAQLLLSKAWRSWVVAWCRSASARVFARQLQAKQQAAVLAALSRHVQHRKRKRALLAAADAFRRDHILPMCVSWWHAWATYSCVLGKAGAAVQQAARQRVLREVLSAWHDLAGFKAWERGALEAAEGFYWSRLAASQFYCWRSHTAQHQQQRQRAQAAAARHTARMLSKAFSGWRHRTLLSGKARCMAAARQAALLREVLGCWWADSVGAKQAFEFQVSSLVRLVSRCFIAWRQLLAAQQLHASSLLRRALDSWHQQTAQGQVLKQLLETWHQQQGARMQQRHLRCALLAWHHVVVLTKGWRGQAPLLAAAYYQERLLQQAWTALRGQLGQHQQQQQLGQRQQQQLRDCIELGLELQGQQQQQASLFGTAAYTVDGAMERVPTASQHEHDCRSSGQEQQLAGNNAVPAPTLNNAQCTADACDPSSAAVVHAVVNVPAVEPSFNSDAQSWHGWQQQQHEQQLELLQLHAAQHHWRAVTLRKTLPAWFTIAATAAATMSQQAQLKHLVQLELLDSMQQQYSAEQLACARLLAKPFRAWQNLTGLKRSAAVGFMCYNNLLKGFVGWRATVREQRHQQADKYTVEENSSTIAQQRQNVMPQQTQEQLQLAGGGHIIVGALPASTEQTGAAAAVQLLKAAGVVGAPAGVLPASEDFNSFAGTAAVRCVDDDTSQLHEDQLPQMPHWWHGPHPEQHQQQQPHRQPQQTGAPSVVLAAEQRPMLQQQQQQISGRLGGAGTLWPASSSGTASGVHMQQQGLNQQQAGGFTCLEDAACLQDLHDAIMGLV